MGGTNKRSTFSSKRNRAVFIECKVVLTFLYSGKVFLLSYICKDMTNILKFNLELYRD